MDDADGGLRGLRARPGPGLFQALQDHWGLGWFAEVVDLGGSSSLNLLVGGGDRSYVVRVHRPHVTRERLGAIHQARRALLAGGVPCAPVVPTRQGEPWVSLKGRLVEVEAYVAHDAAMDSWERLEVAMTLLAQTHRLLRVVQVGEQGRRPLFANHIEPADVQAWTRRGTERIRGWDPTPDDARLAAAAEELAGLVAEAEAGLVAHVPRQLVHGDFWDNNVLFRHGRLVLLADFDFMGERARIDDLALTLWCASLDLGPMSARQKISPVCAASSPATTPAWTSNSRPPSAPRCRRRWPASPCGPSEGGWHAWTTTPRPAATPPAWDPRCRHRCGFWPTSTAGRTPSPDHGNQGSGH
jgi:homoserine kinase type II